MSQQKCTSANGTARGASDASPAQVDNPSNISVLAQGTQRRRLSRDDPMRTARIIRGIRPDLSFYRRKFWSDYIHPVPKSDIYKRLWSFLKRAVDENGAPFQPKPADFEAVYDALREELSNGAWQRCRATKSAMSVPKMVERPSASLTGRTR